MAEEKTYTPPEERTSGRRDVREQLQAIPIPETSVPDDTPADAGEPLIFLDDIHVTFKTRTGSLLHPNKVKAVRGVSIKLMPGETIGIVGESGCGKSTTANVLCGLQKPTSGHVYFKGKDVTNRTAADRKVIGRVLSVVFQDPATALNARMSVHDQLLDPMVVHKVGTAQEREKRVRELIHLVGLPSSCLEALPGQMSGGQRQRVAIARALALSPEAIIADEPTSALDVSVRAQILNLLMDLKKELNLAMVFISHDISTVRYISDRIIVMNKGVIVERGKAKEVFENPKDPYTKLLLGAAGVRYTDGGRPVRRVAVGGGACGSMLADAVAMGCDTFVTADVKYDQFLEARALGVNLLDAGHYATENVICDRVAQYLSQRFPEVSVLVSHRHKEACACV